MMELRESFIKIRTGLGINQLFEITDAARTRGVSSKLLVIYWNRLDIDFIETEWCTNQSFIPSFSNGLDQKDCRRTIILNGFTLYLFDVEKENPEPKFDIVVTKRNFSKDNILKFAKDYLNAYKESKILNIELNENNFFNEWMKS